jgi:hypothetical protein
MIHRDCFRVVNPVNEGGRPARPTDLKGVGLMRHRIQVIRQFRRWPCVPGSTPRASGQWVPYRRTPISGLGLSARSERGRGSSVPAGVRVRGRATSRIAQSAAAAGVHPLPEKKIILYLILFFLGLRVYGLLQPPPAGAPPAAPRARSLAAIALQPSPGSWVPADSIRPRRPRCALEPSPVAWSRGTGRAEGRRRDQGAALAKRYAGLRARDGGKVWMSATNDMLRPLRRPHAFLLPPGDPARCCGAGHGPERTLEPKVTPTALMHSAADSESSQEAIGDGQSAFCRTERWCNGLMRRGTRPSGSAWRTS